MSSPFSEGNSHPFGAAWDMPLCRVFHVEWWAAVMASYCPKQYPVICPTVWIGRFSSVIISPFACRARLHMSHRLDVFLLNLLVKAFTGKLLVMICISRRLSSVLMLEDFRYLLMTCRQLGSRIKKSVVFVEVAGVMGVYNSVGRGCVS